MPIYEERCQNRECRRAGYQKEHYVPHYTEVTDACPHCGRPMARMASRFGVVFTGPITAKYNDPKAENPHQEGHWAYRVRSSSTGHPEPVFIESFEQQRAFCKEEGLVNPKDVPNLDASPDGKLATNAGCGMPGAWV